MRNRASRISDAEFIEERSQRRRQISDADVDKMTRAALARVDEAQTLREVHALREQMKVRSRKRVPGRAKRIS